MTGSEVIKDKVGKILDDGMFGSTSALKDKIRHYLFPLVQDASIKNFVIENIVPPENQGFTVTIIGEKSYTYIVKGTQVSLEDYYNIDKASESFDNLISSEGFEDMMKKPYKKK